MSIILMGFVIIGFLIAVTAAVVILSRNPHSPTYRWLAGLLVTAGAWGLIVNALSPQATLTFNLWIVRGTFIAAVLMTYCMLRFAISVTGRKDMAIFVRYMAVAGGALIALTLSPLMVSSVYVDGAVITANRAVGYYVVIAYILFVCVTTVSLLARARSQAQGRFKRQQLTTILVGVTVGIIVGALTNIVLPNLIHSLAPARYAWVSTLVWTGTLVYAVLRHRFLDIRLAAVRTAAYILSLLTLAAVYYALASVVSKTVLSDVAILEPFSIVMALVLAFIFQPTKHFFDRLTSKLFYRDVYDGSLFFSQLSTILTSTTDLRDLLARASEHIAKTMKSEQVFFFTRYNETNYMFAGTQRHRSLSVDAIRMLDTYMGTHRLSLILCDDIADETVRKVLRQSRIAAVLPLYQSSSIIGYLFLGDQRNGGYSSRDLRILESTPSELVIAIQNALSLQEVRQLNATLQQRIDEATKELRASNEKLQRLDAAKDEFVSMASHQLRTPLTSVKGYISMVLEGDAGKISDMQVKLLGEAFTSSERMVHLINDFLNVSRIQTGKFMIDRRPIDLAKVVGQEVDGLQTTAHAHDLKLQFRTPSSFPILYLDEGKLRQVIMNFIDNAIYYSREFSVITIKLKTEGADVIMTVHDTGMGVPLDEQKHLFTKFFRATNARKQRPDGTGVGIFLAKKVIVAHGGSMIFESVEGKGSTFGFRLPIKKLSLAPADDADKFND